MICACQKPELFRGIITAGGMFVKDPALRSSFKVLTYHHTLIFALTQSKIMQILEILNSKKIIKFQLNS